MGVPNWQLQRTAHAQRSAWTPRIVRRERFRSRRSLRPSRHSRLTRQQGGRRMKELAAEPALGVFVVSPPLVRQVLVSDRGGLMSSTHLCALVTYVLRSNDPAKPGVAGTTC